MSSPTGGSGNAGGAQRGGAALDLFDLASLVVDPSDVQRDGMMDPSLASRYWRTFCSQAGLDPNADLIKLAVSCAAGTSAETDYSERLLDSQNPKSSVNRLVNLLADEQSLVKRVNKLRVFCRSMPSFALLTRQVILANGWLARERAAEYEVDVRSAGVCFDYSDILVREDIELSPTELSIVKYGLLKKAGQGRPAVYSGEGVGVSGSSPYERGVAAAVVPDGGRVSGRGSGPYGRQ